MQRTLLEHEMRTENKRVSLYLLSYPDLKKQWLEYREERLGVLQRPDPADPMPGHASSRPVSDPTGAAGTALIAERERFRFSNGDDVLLSLGEVERWLQLCAEVADRLPWKMQVFLRLRQDTRTCSSRTGGWVPWVQRKYAEEIAKRLGRDESDVWIESRHTFYAWWNRIVEYAARMAAKQGLLDEF